MERAENLEGAFVTFVPELVQGFLKNRTFREGGKEREAGLRLDRVWPQYLDARGHVHRASPVLNLHCATVVVHDGELTLDNGLGTPVWTLGTPDPTNTLHLNANGTVSLAGASGATWRGGLPVATLRPGDLLRPGWTITSPNGRCRLELTSAGALTLFGANGATWWSTGPHVGVRQATVDPTATSCWRLRPVPSGARRSRSTAVIPSRQPITAP